MIVKKHVTPDKRLILAVCDKDILGKKFTENEIVLDLASDFYKGEDTSDKKTEELMKSAYLINMTGKKSVALAKKLSLITEKNIITVQNIPHVQVLITVE